MLAVWKDGVYRHRKRKVHSPKKWKSIFGLFRGRLGWQWWRRRSHRWNITIHFPFPTVDPLPTKALHNGGATTRWLPGTRRGLSKGRCLQSPFFWQPCFGTVLSPLGLVIKAFEPLIDIIDFLYLSSHSSWISSAISPPSCVTVRGP